MSSGSRLATWKERENNMRRERRRRAIAAKIYAGLRMYGSYKLPKHCDNNEVLKALCREAGWIVDEDGTTYRKGCRPVKPMEVVGGSASPSPCSSYQISPPASYSPSPIHSSIPSPKTSSHITNANNIDPNSLIPWLKNLSSSSKIPNYQVNFGSISAPVTPPLSSPTARLPRMKTEWDEQTSVNHTFSPSSTPPSPGRHPIPQPMWLSEIQMPTINPSSPTFSLVSSSPFGFYKDESGAGGSSRMWTPGQSGACSPVMQGGSGLVDVQMSDGASDEFAFGSSGNENYPMMMSVVKPWEGERIHEECGSDELELTLGSSRTRSVA